MFVDKYFYFSTLQKKGYNRLILLKILLVIHELLVLNTIVCRVRVRRLSRRGRTFLTHVLVWVIVHKACDVTDLLHMNDL